MNEVRKNDCLWGALLIAVFALMLLPGTHGLFLKLSASHVYLMAFIKFGILATMGELLAIRLLCGSWKKPNGLWLRAMVWGALGAVISLVFFIFATGVDSALQKGLLPMISSTGAGLSLTFAFFTSTLINCLFAPTFMAFHRITDTYIDLGEGKLGSICKLTLSDVVERIDWNNFVSFVVCRTIPVFWIPAHTVTFLLPAEYRVFVAALLSIALGGILGFSKRGSAMEKG